MRERIEEGIGRGVVGLTWTAEYADDRAVHDDGRQVALIGELGEMPGGIELGGKDAVDAFGRHVAEQPIVERAGGVDDGGERMRGRDGVEDRLERIAVGGVAWSDGDRSTGGVKLVAQGF